MFACGEESVVSAAFLTRYDPCTHALQSNVGTSCNTLHKCELLRHVLTRMLVQGLPLTSCPHKTENRLCRSMMCRYNICWQTPYFLSLVVPTQISIALQYLQGMHFHGVLQETCDYKKVIRLLITFRNLTGMVSVISSQIADRSMNSVSRQFYFGVDEPLFHNSCATLLDVALLMHNGVMDLKH